MSFKGVFASCGQSSDERCGVGRECSSRLCHRSRQPHREWWRGGFSEEWQVRISPFAGCRALLRLRSFINLAESRLRCLEQTHWQGFFAYGDQEAKAAADLRRG